MVKNGTFYGCVFTIIKQKLKNKSQPPKDLELYSVHRFSFGVGRDRSIIPST